MTQPSKCPTCGRAKRTAASKTLSFFIMCAGLGAQTWAFFLVRPLPLRIYFATMVSIVIVAALVKLAKSVD